MSWEFGTPPWAVGGLIPVAPVVGRGPEEPGGHQQLGHRHDVPGAELDWQDRDQQDSRQDP
jgi:hypothetical protein